MLCIKLEDSLLSACECTNTPVRVWGIGKVNTNIRIWRGEVGGSVSPYVYMGDWEVYTTVHIYGGGGNTTVLI